MNISELGSIVVGGLFFVYLGYGVYREGKAHGRREGADEAHRVIWPEAFHAGWVARHEGQELVDTRVPPEEALRVQPNLLYLGAETSNWEVSTIGESFEEYRAGIIAKLNAELMKSKNHAERKG